MKRNFWLMSYFCLLFLNASCVSTVSIKQIGEKLSQEEFEIIKTIVPKQFESTSSFSQIYRVTITEKDKQQTLRFAVSVKPNLSADQTQVIRYVILPLNSLAPLRELIEENGRVFLLQGGDELSFETSREAMKEFIGISLNPHELFSLFLGSPFSKNSDLTYSKMDDVYEILLQNSRDQSSQLWTLKESTFSTAAFLQANEKYRGIEASFLAYDKAKRIPSQIAIFIPSAGIKVMLQLQ